MTATAHIDRLTQLDLTERGGSVVRLVRQARVVDLGGNDPTVLSTALATSGVPAAGSKLTGFPNLVLTERNAKLLDGEKGVVDIDLVYEFALSDIQNIGTPPFGALVGEVTATLNETESNLDVDKTPIELEHLYPADDDVYPNQVVKQGGKIKYLQPQITTPYEGIMTVDRPWLISNILVGSVNGESWNGGGPREWMCMKASYKIHDVGPPARYKMTFEFQRNPDTWDPTAVFIDDRTGAPPVGLVEGVGYKTILKHTARNFEEILGAKVQGG